jgi:hypothetical protein
MNITSYEVILIADFLYQLYTDNLLSYRTSIEVSIQIYTQFITV